MGEGELLLFGEVLPLLEEELLAPSLTGPLEVLPGE